MFTIYKQITNMHLSTHKMMYLLLWLPFGRLSCSLKIKLRWTRTHYLPEWHLIIYKIRLMINFFPAKYLASLVLTARFLFAFNSTEGFIKVFVLILFRRCGDTGVSICNCWLGGAHFLAGKRYKLVFYDQQQDGPHRYALEVHFSTSKNKEIWSIYMF